jgi:hypothetical protein
MLLEQPDVLLLDEVRIRRDGLLGDIKLYICVCKEEKTRRAVGGYLTWCDSRWLAARFVAHSLLFVLLLLLLLLVKVVPIISWPRPNCKCNERTRPHTD